MTEVLSRLRKVEENVRSVHSFFAEARCDGNANSVYFINVDPDDLGEGHQLWSMRVDEEGKPAPITFLHTKNKNIFQSMCAAMAVCSNTTDDIDAGLWATRGERCSAVAFVNLDPKLCGPDSDWEDDEFTAKTMDEIGTTFNSSEDAFRHLAVVGNHPVVREKTAYEESDVTAYPAFAVLGLIYRMEKVETKATFCESLVDPAKHKIGAWAKKLSSPKLIDHRTDLENVNVIFADVISNPKATGVVTHWDKSHTAFTKRKIGIEETLADAWMKKVVLHHFLTRARPTNDAEAQHVADVLNEKLTKLTQDGYFNQARVKSHSFEPNEDKLILEIEMGPKRSIQEIVVQVGESFGSEDED